MCFQSLYYSVHYLYYCIYNQTHSRGNHDTTVITHITIDNCTCNDMVSTIMDAVMACSSYKAYVIVSSIMDLLIPCGDEIMRTANLVIVEIGLYTTDTGMTNALYYNLYHL